MLFYVAFGFVLLFLTPHYVPRVFDKVGLSQLVLFIYLYSVAGFVRLHMQAMLKNWRVRGFALVLLLAVALYYGHLRMTDSPSLLASTSPESISLVSIAVLLLMLLSQVKSSKVPGVRPVILLAAPLAFGVYLIHDDSTIRHLVWDSIRRLFVWASNGNEKLLWLGLLAVPILIYAAGGLVEYLRLLLFRGIGRIARPLQAPLTRAWTGVRNRLQPRPAKRAEP